MRNCLGIPANDYQQHDGQRVSASPMYHYPDRCPYFPGDQGGNCLERCSAVPAGQRPCWPSGTPSALPAEPTVLATHVFPNSGHRVAIVALGGGVDWAAYLGATDGHLAREDTIASVADSGYKLPAAWARSIFPQLAQYPYRD